MGGAAFFGKSFSFKLHARSLNQFFCFGIAAFKAFLVFMICREQGFKRVPAFRAFESVVGHFFRFKINDLRLEWKFRVILLDKWVFINVFHLISQYANILVADVNL
jgi:hypothetical protein